MATGLVIAMILGFMLVIFPDLNFFQRDPLANIILLMVLGLNAGLISALINNPELDVDSDKGRHPGLGWRETRRQKRQEADPEMAIEGQQEKQKSKQAEFYKSNSEKYLRGNSSQSNYP